ncbi:MAG: hypothetical protein H6662_14245 [Ardenticatenaceae bacterium]|nr:hypothetical protein [Anaerolineales bacterium]MCB8922744.1 hypothetical protein [Ardenticatenaceae bacterium]MCB9003551.1 hypothetical protein [Ardenticatenaceae bacterium]
MQNHWAGLQKRWADLQKRWAGLQKRWAGLQKRWAGLQKRWADLQKRWADLQKRWADLQKRWAGLQMDIRSWCDVLLWVKASCLYLVMVVCVYRLPRLTRHGIPCTQLSWGQYSMKAAGDVKGRGQILKLI